MINTQRAYKRNYASKSAFAARKIIKWFRTLSSMELLQIRPELELQKTARSLEASNMQKTIRNRGGGIEYISMTRPLLRMDSMSPKCIIFNNQN